MKVVVINGSPKGKNSITLYTVLFLQKHYPELELDIIDAGKQIKLIEKDFSPYAERILAADLILFSYPVYTFIAPAQLHRFVELMKDAFKHNELKGKFATQITTSKHFYDTTAQNFIKENCADLGLITFDGLYADMEDLTKKRGQKEALDFWRYINFQIEYEKAEEKSEIPATARESSTFRIALVCDVPESDTALRQRVEEFKKMFPYSVEEFNLQTLRIDGGCISCFNCTSSGECIYKDGFADVLRSKIITADAVVYAFTISNHSMGSKFKYYDDRNFCNGHRTMTIDKPVGYIINGNYEVEHNLDTIIKGRASVGHNILTHIATEGKNQQEQKSQLEELSAKLSYCLENPIVQPQNFLGVGGLKIFRDLIYVMGGLMSADYNFYKAQGFFKDFPTKQKKTRLLMKLVGYLFHNPELKKKMGGKIDEGMIGPYKKVLDNLEKN